MKMKNNLSAGLMHKVKYLVTLSLLSLTVALGSSSAYAKNEVCPQSENLTSNLASGNLLGWETDARIISSPVLAQVALKVSHDQGDMIECEYVQKNNLGRWDSFILKKKASSTKAAIDLVNRNAWGPMQSSVTVCTPSIKNNCGFITSTPINPAALVPNNLDCPYLLSEYKNAQFALKICEGIRPGSCSRERARVVELLSLMQLNGCTKP